MRQARAGPLRLRMPGQLALGLGGVDYNYFRDYLAQWGRYLESDPLGMGGGQNTFGYAEGVLLLNLGRGGDSAMMRELFFGIGLLVLSFTAAAAPIRIDFSGPVTSASGVLAGTTGLVEGYFVYDDAPSPEAVQPSLGYYIFTGSPYHFQITVPSLGILESDSVSALVSDDGRYTVTYPDPIDMLSFRTGAVPTTVVPAVSVTFYWTADIGAFSGDGIPTINKMLAMGSPSLAVYPYGDPHYILTAQALSQVAFTVVPLPATAWLLTGGLVSLARLCRWRSERGTRRS